MSSRYECAIDGEDLTKEVLRRIAADQTVVYRLKGDTGSRRPKPGQPRRWRVVVFCSQGHECVFSGDR